jgi:hypothetical protein
VRCTVQLGFGETTDPNLSLDDVWDTSADSYRAAIGVNDLASAIQKMEKREIANPNDVKLINEKLHPGTWEAPKPKNVAVDETGGTRSCQGGDCSVM